MQIGPCSACVGMLVLALLAGGVVARAEGDDLPFAYVGPALPSLAAYADAGDEGNVLETDTTRFLNATARFQWETAELSQLALTQAACTRVRRFAAELMRAQAAMYGELSRLAERKGLRLPGPPDFERGEWMRKSGEEFERDYLARMVVLHETAIAWFETASDQGADDEISAYAAKCLPCLRKHAQRAQNLAETR